MTQAAVGAIAPLIQVNGTELAPGTLNALIGLRVSSGLRIPSRAVLDFLDDGFVVSADQTFKLGSVVVVKMSGGEVLFTGEVTGVELDIQRGAPNLSVIADDAAYKMTLGNKVRTFAQVSFSDVVTMIARENGMAVSASATDSVHDYLLQSDSDFGFLTEMADRAGYDWWVDSEGKLQFHPMGSSTGSVPSVTWGATGGSLQHFSVRASALHPNKITVNGWDAASKSPMMSVSDPVQNKPTAALVLPYLDAHDLAGKNDVASAHRMFATQGDGTALANSVAARAIAGSVIASGVCQINPDIAVGAKVSVTGVGPASGTYPVTEVEHSYSLSGFDTRFTAGDREPTGLVDTLAAPAASSFRQDGLVIGVVTNLDNGPYPGLVKVKFPTLGEQIESAWARVVSAGAGESRGMTFLPEVNDEVIIGFEGGDITRPLVIGGLYGGASAALDYGASNGKIAKRQVVSRLGHVIELGDGEQPGDQHIWLTLAGSEFFVKLGKDGLTAGVPSGQPVTVSAGDSKIQIDAQGNIALSGQKISLTAKQDVEISGMNVKLKADMAVEGSGLQAKLTGTSQAELSSGGQTSVKGTAVMIN